MLDKKIKLVKAFTKDPAQGNPAGVVLDADNLRDEEMIQISARLGFSESAFLQKSEVADYKIRFFTPTQEVDLCAHATISAVHCLDKKGIVKLETKSGIIPVEIQEDGLIVMEQKSPEFMEGDFDKKEIAKLLNISEDSFLDLPIQVVSTGVPKLMIPVKSSEALFAIQPDLEGIKEFCQQYNFKGFYPFTIETKENSDFHARQFNPLAGINEDPITGVAAGALGAYAVKYNLLNKNKFVIEQGYILNKAGKIFVEVGDKIKVGGYAVDFDNKK